MELVRSYGEAATLIFPLLDKGTTNFDSTPPTFAAGDVKIIKDEAVAANTTNLPTHEGNGIFSLALTATEMQAARIAVTIIDQTSPKDWEDQAIIIFTALDTYQAKVTLIDDDTGTNDRYLVVFYKNGQPYVVASGITTPTIQVIKASDGTDLVASTALTEISTLELYKKDEAVNRIVDGAQYIAKITAIIDGVSRTWYQPIGRDTP